MPKRRRQTFCPCLTGILAKVFDVPGEMRREGRSIDHEFPDAEVLYRRFPKAHLSPGAKIPIYAVELPDVSVNRSKYGGKMEYVLYDVVHGKYRSEFGVVSFKAGQIPHPGTISTGTCISIRLKHVPEELNYYHAEIQAHDRNRGHLKAFDDADERWIAAWRIGMRKILTLVKAPE